MRVHIIDTYKWGDKKMRKVWLVVGIMFFFSTPLVLNAVITFERTYEETEGRYMGISVQQTMDDGYIIVGCSFLNVIWLIKTDSLGDTLWTKSFNNPFSSLSLITSQCVRQTTDKGYIITGNLFFGDASSGILIKTDSIGDSLWTKGYNFIMSSVQQTPDKGYIITGSDAYGDYPALCKTDSLGMVVWGKFFYNTTPAGGAGGGGLSVQQLSGKGYIICGTIEDSTYHRFAFLLKTDSLGDSLWGKTYLSGEFSEVQQTMDNNYILTGYTYYQSPGGKGEVILVKADSLGDTLWTKIFGGDSSDYGYSVQQTQDGGFIIAGSTWSFGAGKGDVYLIKTNSLGDTLWTKTFGGTEYEAGSSMQQTTDGGYIVAGYTNSFGAGTPTFFNAYLIKTDPLGCVGIEEKDSEIMSQKLKLEISPNPAISLLNIRLLGTNKGESVNLKIYDLSGRVVKTFSQLEINNLNSSIIWNGLSENGVRVKSGVYFCELSAKCEKAKNTTIREKIVLMRY